MSFQVGDAIALVKLAYQLYQKGVLVARAAPETFKDLLDELLLVKTVLYRIDQSYVAHGRDYDDSATLALRRCRKALLSFQPLVIKYEKLGSTHRGSRLRQLQFPIDRGKIETCRCELEKAAGWLNLVLSAESALGPQDISTPTVEESARPQQPEESDADSLATSPLSPRAAPRLLEAAQQRPALPFLQRVHRIDTLETHVDSDEALLAPTARKVSHTSRERDSAEFSSVHSTDRSSRTSISGSSPPIPHSEHAVTFPPQVVKAALTVARPWYPSSSNVKTFERTLEIDPIHYQEIMDALDGSEVFMNLAVKFAESAKTFDAAADIDDLLVRATWWLLKARAIVNVISSSSVAARIGRQTWPVRVSREQAAADFWKSCWILKNLILGEQNKDKHVSDATWTSLQELASYIHEELHALDSLLEVMAPGTAINRQALAFAELQFQPLEALSALPAGLDNLDPPVRFVTIHEDDAGTSKERVLYRTFVDAQIGPHDTRRRSAGAPYMLLLWSQHGRSEILVSVINQAGTINLCTPLTVEDLQRHKEHSRSELQFELSFPSQDVTIRFLSPDEFGRFLDFPNQFFSALSNRDARQDEFLIFRDGLQAFDHRTPQAQSQMRRDDVTTQAHSSCEISLYGAVPTECWKTVRRLVVSSALDATQPWCHSYWLPISNIQVHGESRDVEISWSDCGNLNSWGDGEYGEYFSYVWDPDRPNHTIHVQFETSEVATEFCSSILRPWETPFEFDNLTKDAQFGSVNANDGQTNAPIQARELSIWRLRDLNVTTKQDYLSIVSIERTAYSGFISSVYFLGEGVDMAMEDKAEHSLHFPTDGALWGPQYLSNVIKTRRRPTVPAECADIEWANRDATFHFANETEMALFAKTIVHWDLKFYVRAPSITMGHGLHSTRKNVLVSLWENPNFKSPFETQVRLAIRWMGDLFRDDDYRWITADITSIADCIARPDSKKLTFRRVEVCQGDELHIMTLKAMDARGNVTSKKGKEIVVALPDAGAVKQLEDRLYELLCGPAPTTSLAYRTQSRRTDSESGSRSSFSSRFRSGR